MKEEILEKNKDNKKEQEKLAERYLRRYMVELKRHFNLNDKSLKKILLNSASIIKSKNLVQNFLNMIKFRK